MDSCKIELVETVCKIVLGAGDIAQLVVCLAGRRPRQREFSFLLFLFFFYNEVYFRYKWYF